MSISTGKGNGGFSSVSDGVLRCKSELCFEVMGDLDELSAALGLAKAAGADRDTLEGFQKTLMKIMSHISCGGDKYLLTAEEAHIPLADKETDLTGFVLPGEGEKSARLHLARAVARRAERSYVRLHRITPSDENAIAFLNSLSDALFIMATE